MPVRPFGEGKSRLAGVLPPQARADLSHRWLAHVLATARQWGEFAGIAVISRDPAVWALAQTFGAQPVMETGADLNSALRQAQAVTVGAGADAVLVLPADLPLLTAQDLTELYDLALAGPGVVIAPAHDAGTNALLLRPPQAIPYLFGEKSFDAHVAHATAAHLPCSRLSLCHAGAGHRRTRRPPHVESVMQQQSHPDPLSVGMSLSADVIH